MSENLIQLRNKIERMRIIIGKGQNRVDFMGNVILNVEDEPKVWIEFLSNELKKDTVETKMDIKKSIMTMELKAAAKLGLLGILPENDRILMNPLYFDLLEMIVSNKIPTSPLFHVNLTVKEKSKLTIIVR
jgi:hypothetical protein